MKPLHDWKLTPEEAIQVQKELRERLDLTWDGTQSVTTIGSVDVGIADESARCAIVVLRFPRTHFAPGCYCRRTIGLPVYSWFVSFSGRSRCAGGLEQVDYQT